MRHSWRALSRVATAIFIEPQQLPVNGTYTIEIDASGAGTGSTTTNAVQRHGRERLGDDQRVCFCSDDHGARSKRKHHVQRHFGSARYRANRQAAHISCVTVTLLKPDGTSLTSTFTCGGTFNLSQQTLPVTGTYTIKVDPNSSSIGSANVSVTNP